ncbi:MAG: hypothetical protein WBN94_01735 [Methanothrix sp.]
MKRTKLAIIFGLVVLAVIQSVYATIVPVCDPLGTFAPGAIVTISLPSYDENYIYTWDSGFPGINPGSGPGPWTWTAPTLTNPSQYPKTYTGHLVVSQSGLTGCAIDKCFTIIVAPTSDCALTPGYTVCETEDAEKTFVYTPKLTDTPSSSNKVVWTINGGAITTLPASGTALSGTGDTTLKIKWKTFVATHGGPGDYIVTATLNGCAKSATVKIVPIPNIGTITATAV